MILRPIDSDQPGTRLVKKGTRCVTGGSVAWEKGDDVAVATVISRLTAPWLIIATNFLTCTLGTSCFIGLNRTGLIC